MHFIGVGPVTGTDTSKVPKRGLKCRGAECAKGSNQDELSTKAALKGPHSHCSWMKANVFLGGMCNFLLSFELKLQQVSLLVVGSGFLKLNSVVGIQRLPLLLLQRFTAAYNGGLDPVHRYGWSSPIWEAYLLRRREAQCPAPRAPKTPAPSSGGSFHVRESLLCKAHAGGV